MDFWESKHKSRISSSVYEIFNRAAGELTASDGSFSVSPPEAALITADIVISICQEKLPEKFQ